MILDATPQNCQKYIDIASEGEELGSIYRAVEKKVEKQKLLSLINYTVDGYITLSFLLKDLTGEEQIHALRQMQGIQHALPFDVLYETTDQVRFSVLKSLADDKKKKTSFNIQ